MKQGRLSFSDVRILRQSPLFSFLTAAFLCGVLAGSIVGMYIPQAKTGQMHTLAALLSAHAAGKMPSGSAVLTCIGTVWIWPAAVAAAGACPGAMFWTALVMALRGSLLSFAVSAALVSSGFSGVYLSAVSIGMPALFWIPALLLLGTAALDAGMKKRYGYAAALGQHAAALFCCTLLLMLCALWRIAAVPVLLRIAA